MRHDAATPGPLRILHVVGGLRPGGVEQWLLRLLNGVDRRSLAMDFVVHTDRPCELDARVRDRGARIFPCPHTRQPWHYARELRRVFREHGPYDVIHSHVFLFSGLVLTLARAWGIRTRIAHFHTPLHREPSGILRSSYESLMLSLIARSSTAILTNSRATHRSLGRLAAQAGEDPVIYPLTRAATPPASDEERQRTRRRYGLPLDRSLVIYLARFAPSKNHRQMLRLADRFGAIGTQARFVMAGAHGELLDHFRASAAQRENLTVLTDFDDPMAILDCADIFFFPSLREGFGIVAHEAAVSGLPVVASDLPGLREAVAPACHELLFPPDGDDRAFDALARLISDAALRTRLGEDSRAWAGSMTPEGSLGRLLAAYGVTATSPARAAGSRTAPTCLDDEPSGLPGDAIASPTPHEGGSPARC